MKVRLILVVLGLMFVSGPVSAVKYMSIGQAVKTFIPKGAKIMKASKALTPEQKKRLIQDYGWTPKKDKFVFYVGRDTGGNALAYVIIVSEIFNTCFHKYAIGMKTDGEVIDAVVVELSCPRATPINRKSFLKQFRKKRHTDPLTIRADIDAITGATLSSESTAQATRKAVSLHNLFFGGAKPVTVSKEVQEARKKADALIKKAIETGETIKKDGKTGPAQLPKDSGK
jgi:FMN-binding protein